MRRDSRHGALLLMLAAGALLAGPVLADDSREWLQRMNAALTGRNYVGDFFHVQDGRVEALRIIHRVERGEVRERLVSLDGSGREFIRTGTELACYLPDKRTVVVEQRSQQGTLLANLPTFDDSTTAYYDIKSLERTRLMGRDTRVIAVTPRDEYRYGYRLWIDESTAMPLKTQLCDGHGTVIEQIVFANISLPERIPDSAFVPRVSTEGFRWVSQAAHGAEPGAAPATGQWGAVHVPPGFHMTARAERPMPGSAGPVEHLVFSDGLASVSVFVETQAAPDALGGESVSRVGSSSAFSTVVDGHQVTAVGEVPPMTVRMIASSVHSQGPGPGPLAPAPLTPGPMEQGTPGASGPLATGPLATGPVAQSPGGAGLLSSSPVSPGLLNSIPSRGLSLAPAR